MHQFVQTNEEAPESGGTLIGRYISGTDDVVVDEITVPLPSELDQATWIKKLFRDRFGESLFFLIVGTERIRAWEGRPGTGVKKLTGKDQSPLLQ
jgi:hypothetical protein